MATVQENKERWTTYEWTEGGDEWSEVWGGTNNVWNLTVLPRINEFLPANHILEIAPGYGRCTQFLVPQCKHLTLVDLAENCIRACQKRFQEHRHITYVVNDGMSLAEVPDNSIDFVFSWDSLVHVEKEVMHSYLKHLSTKLRENGYGFIHHSNIGAFKSIWTNRLKVENKHWRGESMSAQLFRRYCAKVGLQCLSQEIIGWGGTILNDCFSIIRKSQTTPGECRIVENKNFMMEALTPRNPGGAPKS